MVLGVILIGLVVSHGIRRKIVDFCKNYIMFVIAAIVSCMFIILTHHTSTYSRFPIELYSTVLLGCLLSKASLNKINILAIVCLISTIVGISIVIPKSIDNYESYDALKSQIKRNRLIITADNISTDRYTARYISPLHNIYQSCVMNSADRVKIYYNGKSESSILSTEMYGLMQKYNAPGTRIYKPSWAMSCVRVPDSVKIDSVIYTLNPVDISSMPFWKRMIAPWLGRYTLNEVPAHRYHILYLNNERWLIVLDNPMVNDRVNGMRICIKE